MHQISGKFNDHVDIMLAEKIIIVKDSMIKQKITIILFQHGPLALVRVNGGSFGSPSPGALGPVEIVSSYLGHNLYNKVMQFIDVSSHRNLYYLTLIVLLIFYLISILGVAFT